MHKGAHRAKGSSGRLIGVLSLALIGAATFLFVYAYLGDSLQKASQTASVAEAQTLPNPFDTVSIGAKSAIVVDLKTGKTLYEKNADAQLPLASITKVAMALAVSEVLDPSQTITIPYNTAYAGSPPTRLQKGEQWKERDVMNFTLIASSNEGAQILADAADAPLRAKYPNAPASDTTLWRMNELVKGLGLTHTYFLNVNGLDISTTQSGAYGTARELATLFAYAASSSPSVFAGTAEDGIHLVSEDGASATPHNTNEALGAIPGLIMGKTGYTDLAGGNLGVVFDVGLAHPVVAIVLGSSYDGRFADMQALVSAARAKVMQQ